MIMYYAPPSAKKQLLEGNNDVPEAKVVKTNNGSWIQMPGDIRANVSMLYCKGSQTF